MEREHIFDYRVESKEIGRRAQSWRMTFEDS